MILIYKTKVCFFGANFRFASWWQRKTQCKLYGGHMVIGTREDSKKQSTLLFDVFFLWMLDILKSDNSPNIGLNLWCKSYWILNIFFIENFMKSKLKMCKKLGHTLGIVKQPLMKDILWRWFHNF
jgi:hypothetical protein